MWEAYTMKCISTECVKRRKSFFLIRVLLFNLKIGNYGKLNLKFGL